MLSSHGYIIYCTLGELFVCGVCVYRVLTHVHKPDVNTGWLPLWLITLFFETKPLAKPEAYNFG